MNISIGGISFGNWLVPLFKWLNFNAYGPFNWERCIRFKKRLALVLAELRAFSTIINWCFYKSLVAKTPRPRFSVFLISRS